MVDPRTAGGDDRGAEAAPAVPQPPGPAGREGSGTAGPTGTPEPDSIADTPGEGDEVITILDTEGLVRYASPAVSRVLGYRPDDLVGRDFLDMVHPEEVGELGTTFRELTAEQGASLTIRCRARHRDGEWRLLQSTATNLIGSGYVNGVIVSSRDLTRHRRREEQLRHAQKMEAVGRLAGGVAHDFNNVLTAIHGFASFVLETLDDDDMRRDDVLEILRAAERGTGLSRQLLSFSRRQPASAGRSDLNQIVREAESMLRPLLGAQVALSLDLDEVPSIVADPLQLHQIILNLAVNARDAMPQGGRLTLRSRFLPREQGTEAGHTDEPADRRDARVMLAVEDNGAGMSREVLERAFEPFFTTKTAEHGTGLGLSTVYGIVRQYGGHVWVYSEPGHGTSFKIYFPPAGETDAPQQQTQETPTPPKDAGATVLIVEDDDAIRPLMARVLRQRGYTVHEASSGDEALTRLGAIEGGIDLVVTDVMMPGMNGRELLRRVRQDRPGTRALLLSGYSRAEMNAREKLEDPFLEKPFEPRELAHAVRDVLARGP